MSFLGGPECSTAANPLSQFTKHVQEDKSLQRDRLVGRGPRAQDGIRSGAAMGWQDKSMDDFLQESRPIPNSSAAPFAMEQMRQELDRFQARPLRTHSASPAWSAEFKQNGQAEGARLAQTTGFAPAEFARFQHMRMGSNSSEAVAGTLGGNASTMNGLHRPMGMSYGMNMSLGGVAMPQMARYGGSGEASAEVTAEGKGKGRMIELDDENWEAQFAQIDAEGTQTAEEAEANRAMEEELNEMDRSVLSETDVAGDFESLWRGIQAENAAARGVNAEDGFMPDTFNIDDLRSWDDFEGVGAGGLFDADPQMGQYQFEEENLYKNVHDPFGEGVRILEEGGNLSLAALAFEAAVQKDPEHVEAWTMLGSAQAQNEKETPAIRALERALVADPHNLAALMGLAVSYTNEGYDSTAYRTLERWLAVKYPQIGAGAGVDTAPAEVGFTDRVQLHERVTELFIRAAQLSPDGEHMDPDVQVGLGVLFYGAEAYDKAVDCFSAALASTEAGTSTERSQVHLLWNRLGATLANSGRSEEAIAAYEKALTLKPNFVRARYNLGVSCINIGCFDEAAQHLLGALAMHRVVEQEGRARAREVVNGSAAEGAGAAGMSEAKLEELIVAHNQSTNLLDTLRRVFSQMGRRDLADRVGPGMEVDSFRGEFEF